MTSIRRNTPALATKPLPTDRVLAHEQLAITRASCAAKDIFTASDLGQVTGVPARRCGLVMAFVRAYGLIEQAPGRSAYRPTEAGKKVAQAWEASEEKGLRALSEAWQKSWFARGTSHRLAQGPALRIGLVSKLMRLSQADEAQHRKVEILVDLMVSVGMLRPEDGGYLRWNEDATIPKPRTPSRAEAADSSPADAPVDPSDENAAPAVSVPRPRPSADMPASGTAHEDLIRLLSPPILLADLARLSAEDMVALHGHLRGLAAILAKLRGSPMT
ncbi:hypothetical protein [Streptomyces odonnellii]|uniref:hypothetical protein n=1 Tax=Streptomyces odonnellii TaxID=1417980 RepID=UPI00062597E4|nr:hypothetical protein [Streptomyces odonnellii]